MKEYKAGSIITLEVVVAKNFKDCEGCFFLVDGKQTSFCYNCKCGDDRADGDSVKFIERN